MNFLFGFICGGHLKVLHRYVMYFREKYDVNDPESQLAILLQKDKRLVDLEHLVSTISEEKEMLNAENKSVL